MILLETSFTYAKVRDLEMNPMEKGYLPVPSRLFDWVFQEKMRFPEATTLIVDPSLKDQMFSSIYSTVLRKSNDRVFGLKVEFKPLKGLLFMLRKDINDED